MRAHRVRRHRHRHCRAVGAQSAKASKNNHTMPKTTSEPMQGIGPGGHPPLAAGAPALRAEDTLAQAASAALGTNLRQLLASTEALRQDAQDPETLHQLHVALTRFRSTVRLFDLQCHDPRWRAACQQARVLAKVVGKARDLEVFCTGALQAICQVHPGDRALRAFAARARSSQTQARDECRKALCAPEATRFALETLGLSERVVQASDVRAGTDAYPGSDPALHAPVAPFLQRRLQKLWARLYRRLCHAHSARSWHLARLAAKALRHALELALPVLPHRRRRARALKNLVHLQQRLGQAHDQTMVRKLARRLAIVPNDPTKAHALTLVEAWCAAHRQSRPPSQVHLQKIQAQLGKLAKKPKATDGKWTK